MRRDDLVAKLKKTEPALRANGVRALYLFGSHARDDGRKGSDVDVFVDPQTDDDFGFIEHMNAYAAIVDAVGPGIDVGYSTRDGLLKYARGSVEREAPRVF
jgi:predicted nucleotidyltransferase